LPFRQIYFNLIFKGIIYMTSLINYDDKKVIADLKNTVALNTTDSEFKMFVEVCKGTNLNPFLKEIWCIKTTHQVQIMVGLNGYLKIANSHPDFDGMTTRFEYDDKGKPIACFVDVYRKSRKYPSVGYAFFDEVKGMKFNKEARKWEVTDIWLKRPSQMLEKCAIANGIRKAFATELAGTYIPEEMVEDLNQRGLSKEEEKFIDAVATDLAKELPAKKQEQKKPTQPTEPVKEKLNPAPASLIDSLKQESRELIIALKEKGAKQAEIKLLIEKGKGLFSRDDDDLVFDAQDYISLMKQALANL